MKTYFKDLVFRLSPKATCLLVITCFASPSLLKAKEVSIKDSVLIILKSGRDKRYYKSCTGKDVRLLSSFERNQIEITTLVDGVGMPLVSGLNDTRCSENISLMRLALNNILAGKTKFENQNNNLNNH
ncbi:MAG: hypothetical protein KA163_08890 [Bacteroidia bacterium]|nr:hypothetical protein [Bacteroidia bacterium]